MIKEEGGRDTQPEEIQAVPNSKNFFHLVNLQNEGKT
jgi:hypothetical protein